MLSIPRLLSSAAFAVFLHQGTGVRPTLTSKKFSSNNSAFSVFSGLAGEVGTVSHKVRESLEIFAQGLGVASRHPKESCIWKKRPDVTAYTCMGNTDYLLHHRAISKLPKNSGLRASMQKLSECYEMDEKTCLVEGISCSWDVEDKRCTVTEGEKDALILSFAKLLDMDETCGDIGALLSARTELEDKCEEGQLKGLCPSGGRAGGKCGEVAQFLSDGKVGSVCTYDAKRCIPIEWPFACENQEAMTTCSKEWDKAGLSLEFGEDDPRRYKKDSTTLKAKSWVDCLRNNGCAELANFEEKQRHAALTCARLDVEACRIDTSCIQVDVAESKEKVKEICKVDDLSTFHELALDSCSLKPLFKLHLKCKKTPQEKCKEDCHWTTRAVCQHVDDKVSPRTGYVGVCTPKMSVWLSTFAQMTKKPEAVALMQPVKELELCREKEDKESCLSVKPGEVEVKKRKGKRMGSKSRTSSNLHVIVSTLSLTMFLTPTLIALA